MNYCSPEYGHYPTYIAKLDAVNKQTGLKPERPSDETAENYYER